MIYLDTSAMVKLYFREDRSRQVAAWLKKQNEAVPLTALHELEFHNALHLKRFRDEIDEVQTALVRERIGSHEKLGVFFRPQVDWPSVFILALQLSKRHSPSMGARSLDILHVALALTIDTDRFVTLDQRQASLAKDAGLNIPAL